MKTGYYKRQGELVARAKHFWNSDQYAEGKWEQVEILGKRTDRMGDFSFGCCLIRFKDGTMKEVYEDEVSLPL